MMTPGSRHIAAKSTQRLLLARRVNFLVLIKLGFNLLEHEIPEFSIGEAYEWI